MFLVPRLLQAAKSITILDLIVLLELNVFLPIFLDFVRLTLARWFPGKFKGPCKYG